MFSWFTSSILIGSNTWNLQKLCLDSSIQEDTARKEFAVILIIIQLSIINRWHIRWWQMFVDTVKKHWLNRICNSTGYMLWIKKAYALYHHHVVKELTCTTFALACLLIRVGVASALRAEVHSHIGVDLLSVMPKSTENFLIITENCHQRHVYLF